MNLNYDFFRIDKTLKPKKGRLLISEPFLQDAYFKRSVILLTEHNKEGSVGFVLNKPAKITVSDVVEDFPEVNAELSIGGPVATDTIHFCHSLGELVPNSVRINNNIYWGGDFNTIKSLIKTGLIDNSQIRFFIGYSGWGEGQLERELSENSWVVADIRSWNILTHYDKSAWKDALNNLGEKYKMWANYPENPVLN